MAAMTASSTWAVQMLLVAFSQRMRSGGKHGERLRHAVGVRKKHALGGVPAGGGPFGGVAFGGVPFGGAALAGRPTGHVTVGAPRQRHRLRGGGGLVEQRGTRYKQRGQVAHHGLKVEQRLEAAL